MVLILEEMLEFPKSDLYEFEISQAKTKVIEWHEEDSDITDSEYDYFHGSGIYVNCGLKMKNGSLSEYENEPYPCGSGKKYKQCCGRKRK